MEDKMLAALKTAHGDFELQEVAIPQITHPDWVLARVRVAGICGTDLRHWKKEEPELECKIMGHELAGDVIEVGSAVTNVKPGDRVVIETVLGDGTCDWCRIQQYNLCPHLYPIRMESVSRAFAHYLVGPSSKFYKLPENVSYQEATLLDTFSVGLHALQLSGLRINETVVIIGAGPIGLGMVQLAKASGAEVIVTDLVESALEMARSLGADHVINTLKDDAYEQVLKLTNLRGADIAFECAGGVSMGTTLSQATRYTRIGGKVVIVGGFDPGPLSIELEWQRIQMGEIKIIPSASYSYWGIDPEMQICLDLLAKGKLDARKLITHSFPLTEINKAFATADDKENTQAIFVALIM